jgi:hypothetical protein
VRRPSPLKITMKKGRLRIRWVSQLMKSGRREWDDQSINSCMYPYDACEVLKIRLLGMLVCLFTVCSAYKLALQEEKAEMRLSELK